MKNTKHKLNKNPKLKKELISIIIVNWNGKRFLKDCFNSLLRQNYKNFEIIFVDNASSDDSVDYITKQFTKKLSIKIIENKQNYGFAKGNNVALPFCSGKYILLLNNDTICDTGTVRSLISPFKKNAQLAAVQPKLVQMDNQEKLDACGSFWSNTGFLYHYGIGKNSNLSQYNKTMQVFSNKGACMMIKKKVIDKIGLFDNDYGSYYEESDFCHRAWLSGFECIYYPTNALVHHKVGGTSLKLDNAEIQFHNFKNKLLTFIKNLELKSLLKTLPIYLLFNVVLSIAQLVRLNPKFTFAIYRAIWWNIRNIIITLEKRKKVQALRTCSDNEIFSKVGKEPRISYYYYLLTGLRNYKD